MNQYKKILNQYRKILIWPILNISKAQEERFISFQLEYIEKAIERLLQHKQCASNNVDTIAILGHSKGGDLALAASATFPDKIELSIVNSCHLEGFSDKT